jgi:hypothetical protein
MLVVNSQFCGRRRRRRRKEEQEGMPEKRKDRFVSKVQVRRCQRHGTRRRKI